MSQSYFPPIRTQASPEPSSKFEQQENHLQDVQHAYIVSKDRLVLSLSLVNALDASKSLLFELRAFNKDTWAVRYPQFREKSDDVPVSASIPALRRKPLRRSLTFADEPAVETEVVITPSGSRAGATTVCSLSDVCEEHDELEQAEVLDGERLIPASDAADFQLLRLDLKLGSHGSSTSPMALVSQLERSSIANLIDEKLGAAEQHVDKLRVRVQDTSSKVLVTGDLNAGKSTFVNALLQRDVMPVDQQPCTTAFCEVHDCADNAGVEEVHIVKDTARYNVRDEGTFTRLALSELEEFVVENESTDLVLKLYLQDAREPSLSLINNGVADISLIDAPGLNRDNTKTTALFARQEEIDVVVFVVSAENHFTLSAKEFLTTASNEKAYIFIVVNKFDHIKNKDKCRRIILEQIREFSPRTYEEADDLVHFVDSVSGIDSVAFEALEASLRSFVLVKRAKSKLNPASTYLSHLLSDVDLLVGANRLVAQAELERARDDVSRVRPVLEKMKNCRDLLEDSLEQVEEDSARTAASRTVQILTDALERIGKGIPGANSVSLPPYPGLLNIWDYVCDVRKALVSSVDAAVRAAEDEARLTTTHGVQRVSELAEEHLPEGVERNRRVFMPEAMFSSRRARLGKGKVARRGSAVVAGGTLGLGLGLAARPDFLEASFGDIFDTQHFFYIYFPAAGKSAAGLDDDESTSPTILGVFGVGLGALTMIGGQAVGARALIEGAVRVSDLLGNESSRKWIGPVVGAVALGAAAWFVLELPSTVPRTIGRRIRRQLVASGKAVGTDSFAAGHADRIGHETRKVVRLVSWDLRERFRTAMEERGREVRNGEEAARRAGEAVERFTAFERRTESVRTEAGIVKVA
ncbi:hypothetical protein K488DRAFT_43802 [Vararia minispora EC-137]|uniref:Uncharacterized protein n=1 Tax=Vararia minispora EC-137 TaxID=1314806 RepID=A0ACB8QUU2_9AGAM|nr:hypothetical protein K488DRAFT_43802 [Vararia minispora EC-137]